MTEGYIGEARDLIRKAIIEHTVPAVACSFGKCSVVTLHLVLQHSPNVLVVFCNTGVEYPQTLRLKEQLKKEWNLNLVETKPYKKNFWDCIDEYGIPSFKSKKGKSFPKCCYYLKERPAQLAYRERKVDLVFTGLRAEESRNRLLLLKYGYHEKTGQKYGLYYHSNKQKISKCHPIGLWDQKQVDDYIEANNIPVSDVYKPPMNLLRSGCMPCTAYIGWKRQLARTNPKLLRILLKKQGQSNLEEYHCPGGA